MKQNKTQRNWFLIKKQKHKHIWISSAYHVYSDLIQISNPNTTYKKWKSRFIKHNLQSLSQFFSHVDIVSSNYFADNPGCVSFGIVEF